MDAFEEIQNNIAGRKVNILKGFVEVNDAIEKARNVGDVHPNGKWVWKQLPSGKFDWRTIPGGGGQASAPTQSAQPKKEDATPTVEKFSQKLISDKLGQDAAFFKTKGAKSWDDVTPLADFGVPAINCGANCSQYNLKTSFGYSVLDMIEQNKGMALFQMKGGGFNFGSINSLKVGDVIKVVSNDNYNRDLYTSGEVESIITDRKGYQDYLRRKGYQVFPPQAFKKPTGHVSRGFAVASIKGVIDLNHLKNSKAK